VKISWETTDHFYTFVHHGDCGLLLCVERILGSRLYGAIALEGVKGATLAQFVEHADRQVLIGAKYRTVGGAKKACEGFARRVQREWKAAPVIEVIEATDADRVFIRTWASMQDAPQA
jgi:hypothetical protein